VNSSEYFEMLQRGLDGALDVAKAARSRGLDPTTDVEVPLAVDLAERVEKLIGIPGIAVRIREMEAEGLAERKRLLPLVLILQKGGLERASQRSSLWKTPSAHRLPF